MKFEIPRPLKIEHEELHEILRKATEEPGKLGDAAKAVAKLMHPHFLKEEEYASCADRGRGVLLCRNTDWRVSEARVNNLSQMLKASPLTLLFDRWWGGCSATTKEELYDEPCWRMGGGMDEWRDVDLN